MPESSGVEQILKMLTTASPFAVMSAIAIAALYLLYRSSPSFKRREHRGEDEKSSSLQADFSRAYIEERKALVDNLVLDMSEIKLVLNKEYLNRLERRGIELHDVVVKVQGIELRTAVQMKEQEEMKTEFRRLREAQQALELRMVEFSSDLGYTKNKVDEINTRLGNIEGPIIDVVTYVRSRRDRSLNPTPEPSL